VNSIIAGSGEWPWIEAFRMAACCMRPAYCDASQALRTLRLKIWMRDDVSSGSSHGRDGRPDRGHGHSHKENESSQVLNGTAPLSTTPPARR
jgi:hypothetical protein